MAVSQRAEVIFMIDWDLRNLRNYVAAIAGKFPTFDVVSTTLIIMEKPQPLTLTISRGLVRVLIVIPIVVVTTILSLIFYCPFWFIVLICSLIAVLTIIACRLAYHMNNKKLVIDEHGITAKDFQVSWDEVTSCKYEYYIHRTLDRYRILIINTKTKGARRYEEKLNGYGYNKYELARAIDENAGRKIFKLKKSLLQERHERTEEIVFFTICFLLPSIVIVFYTGEYESIIILLIVALSIPLSFFISKKDMKWWKRRNGYKG